jgi:hypothetical protein
MVHLPRRVVILILVYCALIAAPFVVAWATAPPDTTFSGMLINRMDYASHLAKMQQGYRGEWAYRLLFTSEPHDSAPLVQTFYVALGHAARLTGLSLPFTYHAARLVFSALMIVALWAFMRRWLTEQVAWWGLLLCLFAGGWGLLLYLIAPDMTREVAPIELWLIDAYTFFSALTYPHFTAGIGLLVMCAVLIDRWTLEARTGQAAGLLVASVALGIVQPFDLLVVDAVLVAAWAWRVVDRIRVGRPRPGAAAPPRFAGGEGNSRYIARLVGGLGIIGAVHAVLVLYFNAVLNGWPVWKAFTAQNVTPSPTPIYYLLGFAPLLIPAVGGIALAIRRRASAWLVPLLWVGVVSVLVYAPLATQRRFTLGVQAPLALLSVYWISETLLPALRRRFRPAARQRLLIVYACATVFSSAINWTLPVMDATSKKADPDIYLPDTTRQAWQWIRDNTQATDVFIGALESGRAIAAHTGRTVVLGHWIETADYQQKLDAVRAFFAAVDRPNQWRWQVIAEHSVTYIWYGAAERALGAWQPTSVPQFRPVYENADVTIYRIEWVT